MIKISKNKKEAKLARGKEREAEDAMEPWLIDSYEEGQLSLDVYQTADALVVLSTIAGAGADDVEVFLDNDLLTIRGQREFCEDVNQEDYLYRECYWGKFSRSVILPVEVEENKVQAVINNGVLKVILPKVKNSRHSLVKVKDE